MFKFPEPGLDEFYRTYNVRNFALSKDEQRIAFSSNLSGKFNLWGIDLPNTYPYPLTYRDQAPAYVQFDPLNRYILVGFDQDGDELVQMFALSPHGGEPTPVCAAPGHRVYLSDISDDGNRIYFQSDKDNAQYMNGYRYDLVTGEETTLIVGDGGILDFGPVSEDESAFVYALSYSNTHSIAYVNKAGESICLTDPDAPPHTASNALFVDEDTLLCVTNYNAPFRYLARFNMVTQTLSAVFAPQHDVQWVKRAHGSDQVFVCVSHGVEDELYVGSLSAGTFAQIDFPGAVLWSASIADSGRLYVMCGQENRPQNLFRRELDGIWIPLTNNRVPGIPEEQMTRAQTVHYPSFDGMQIEGLLYKASSERSNGHTIIMPHGGPEASDQKFFWSFTQYLIWQGYDVFQANFRGSTGYGAAFGKLVARDWGGGPYKDMVAGIEWLLAQGLAHRDRLFVLGGSYGGYMTLMLHARSAHYFRAAVDIFGPSNLFSFVNSVPDFWKPIMDAWVGNPEKDADMLREFSPITHLEGMTKPMLVIQGANDPRVVKAESDQIVAALREKGREVEYLVLEDEGHGFSKK
ncbi:MAG: prolyl oligopeptidase family serine peptidase, partial [Firmicutes bacterium]|nr:prolyl oligopeptidase family serine peptidase [Bacillota bacterium]